MSLTHYHCTHCGHSFEAEEKDNLECPACFWTSSVVREAEHREAQARAQQKTSQKTGSGIASAFWAAFGALKPLFIAAFILAIAAAVFVWFKPRAGTLVERIKSKKREIQAPEGAGRPQVLPASDNAMVPKPPAALSDAENAILARKVELDSARELSSMERELLGRRAALRTGRIEKLPGPAWTLEQFKEMLAEQQNAYKIPLARSYRKKLEKLFEEKYLTAAAAFSDGRRLEARNLWVESLAFPVYAGDIEKHRGVVLTMLKPFINDTLSKIGAMNGMLAEGPVRDLEIRLNAAYEQFFGLLEAQKWDAAYDAAQSLLALTGEFDKISTQKPQVPAYPPAVQIDRDIGKALYDLLEASQLAVADVSSLARDVRMKKQIIETLLPGRFEESLNHYRAGFAAMDQAQWQAAIDSLQKIQEPALLERDSMEKIKILQKLVQAELDSGPVSS